MQAARVLSAHTLAAVLRIVARLAAADSVVCTDLLSLEAPHRTSVAYARSRSEGPCWGLSTRAVKWERLLCASGA